MHPLACESIRRWLGYHWGSALIQDLTRARFGLRLSRRCLDTLRNGAECSARCRESCPFKDGVM